MTGLPRERRHTLLFLRLARQQAAILLDTEVDMTAVLYDRARSGNDRAAFISYVIHGAARALAAHPDANAMVTGGRRGRARYRRYDAVVAKVAFDRQVGGVRAVMAGLIGDAARTDLQAIDERVRYFKACDPATAPELAGMRALQRLPWPLARAGFAVATARLRRRPELLGTFAVSSLGHRAVAGFYPLGGTAVSLGIGRIREVPVVRDGTVVVAPILRLGMVFDHRVLDGALAADVLSDIRQRLETWDGTTARDGVRSADGAQP